MSNPKKPDYVRISVPSQVSPWQTNTAISLPEYCYEPSDFLDCGDEQQNNDGTESCVGFRTYPRSC
jgi:hypothetical protein